jgi:hypothetical protein
MAPSSDPKTCLDRVYFSEDGISRLNSICRIKNFSDWLWELKGRNDPVPIVTPDSCGMREGLPKDVRKAFKSLFRSLQGGSL